MKVKVHWIIDGIAEIEADTLEQAEKLIDKKLKFPVVIKPLNEGSSVNVFICSKFNIFGVWTLRPSAVTHYASTLSQGYQKCVEE